MNTIKKFLQKELGESRYDGLVNFVNKYSGPEQRNDKEIYEELYEFCARMEVERIMERQLRLNDMMYQAFQVGKTYSLAFFIYLGAWFFLLSANLQTELLIGGILAISLCFGVKTYQFFSSRCAYVDARIIETYRTVLHRILERRAREEREFK